MVVTLWVQFRDTLWACELELHWPPGRLLASEARLAAQEATNRPVQELALGIAIGLSPVRLELRQSGREVHVAAKHLDT